MKRPLLSVIFILWVTWLASEEAVLVGADATLSISPEASPHDIHFDSLAKSWDEAIPLGNGLVGALIWQKGTALRFSLDRADLWDLRPVEEFAGPNFRFSWICQQVRNGDYQPVQKLTDLPYERDAGPSKIPAAGLQFPMEKLGEVEAVHLFLREAICEVRWKSGASLFTFVHATHPVGWFRFEGISPDLAPEVAAPPYGTLEGLDKATQNSVEGNDLRRLGYPKPELQRQNHLIRYHQRAWGELSIDVIVSWQRPAQGVLEGVWRISMSNPKIDPERAVREPELSSLATFAEEYRSHQAWWRDYWQQSSLSLPDPVLETQWYREVYKFGSASRRGAPPISLQAVWTADNGRIPPWKGDYHHDLNTQLSYWPCYSGNHLQEGMAYLDWLWNIRPTAFEFTKNFYATGGLNVPGVTTLAGEPMGGWAQYSLSPTTSAWLAHHFYLQWLYSGDRQFLEERAYPWIRDVALFLDQVSIRGKNGRRKLPLSSSPEINDNRIDAWFQETTNYDLALIRWLYGAATELAGELEEKKDADRWQRILAEWPDLAISPEDGKLLVAPGISLQHSHRHFSHLMAIYPLGSVDWANGPKEQQTIRASLAELDRLGPSEWCGYSYAWLGNLAARALDGDRAANALRIFSQCFCLPNSFHANGDQSKSGKSNFTYRPFTLEGNFAFAAGIQEMLLQSHTGVISVFPAIPASWKNVSFEKLRARGAFLVSARLQDGHVKEISVLSERGGRFRLRSPFEGGRFSVEGIAFTRSQPQGAVLEFDTLSGSRFILKAL